MAHPLPEKAMASARYCLKVFEEGGVGCWHLQSQRFLSPQYVGSPSDPPLRALVCKLANGTDRSNAEMLPLVQWLSRFACIKVAERSVEGVHSNMTTLWRRAPRASVAYVSVELRFPNILESFSQPNVS